MILSAHQPAYLPWLGFFHKIAISDAFILLDEVQYEKNSFINRNKIKTPKGDIWLTIPVLTSGHFEKTISEMQIDNNRKWRNKHWKSIEFNYKKTIFFSKYQVFFRDFYQKDWKKLIDILNESIQFLLKSIGIKTPIYRQSELNFKSKKQELIIDMCEYFNSDIFIFGKLGSDYVEKSYFKKRDIKVYFQDYFYSEYPQLYGKFIPNLSIIDLLFNVGPKDALGFIMNENISKSKLNEIDFD